jgi:hypothetical protein
VSKQGLVIAFTGGAVRGVGVLRNPVAAEKL